MRVDTVDGWCTQRVVLAAKEHDYAHSEHTASTQRAHSENTARTQTLGNDTVVYTSAVPATHTIIRDDALNQSAMESQQRYHTLKYKLI